MQPSPKLREELGRAASAIEAMERSATISEFEDHWKEFLSRIERIWFKAHAHFGRSPKWNGWKGKYEGQRNSDPLLSYLRNARGADEHTIADIVDSEPGSITILAGPSGAGTMRNLVIGNGKVSAQTTGSTVIEFKSARVRLLPVTNRSVQYPVPTSHLGATVQPENVISIAMAGIQYYANFLDAADEFFVK